MKRDRTMRILWPLAAASLLLGLSAAAARPTTSNTTAQSKSGLRPVPVGEDENPARGVQDFDAQRWRTKLLDADLEARERAFDHLVQLARREPAARKAIQDWMAEDSGELAWTARLLQREVDHSQYRFRNLPQVFSLGRPMEFDFKEMESELRSLDELFGKLGQGFDQGFKRLDPSQIEELLERGSGGLGNSRSQNFSLQVGPDGVTCKVSEEVDGKEEIKEYKAETLEALLEAHPELRDTISVRGGLLGGLGRPTIHRLEDLMHSLGRGGVGRSRGQTPWSLPQAIPTDILGIEFRKLPRENVEAHGIPMGVGLYVERTIPGTIAHILGIKRGDLLLELNEIQLVDGDDVSQALEERAPEQAIVVTLIDLGGQRRTLTWKPSEEEQAERR